MSRILSPILSPIMSFSTVAWSTTKIDPILAVRSGQLTLLIRTLETELWLRQAEEVVYVRQVLHQFGGGGKEGFGDWFGSWF